MTALYQTYRSSPKVEIVNVEKFTDSSVWIDGRRRARITSDWRCYFETLDAALDHLEHLLGTRINYLKRDLQTAQSALGEVRAQRKRNRP